MRLDAELGQPPDLVERPARRRRARWRRSVISMASGSRPAPSAAARMLASSARQVALGRGRTRRRGGRPGGRPPAVWPPMTIGTRPSTGRGRLIASVKRHGLAARTSPCPATTGRAWPRRTRRCAGARSGNETPMTSNSSSSHPMPTPSTTRPPDSTSSVADLLGQDHRVALGEDQDAGAEAQGRRVGGDPGEPDERVGDVERPRRRASCRSGSRGRSTRSSCGTTHVLDGPQRVEPGRLGGVAMATAPSGVAKGPVLAKAMPNSMGAT